MQIWGSSPMIIFFLIIIIWIQNIEMCSKNMKLKRWKDIEKGKKANYFWQKQGLCFNHLPDCRSVLHCRVGFLLGLRCTFHMDHSGTLTRIIIKCQNLISLIFGFHKPFSLPGYHGPLDLYPEFHRIATDPTIHTVPEGRPVNVCVGKEWYRFPSSFLLPDK